MEGSVIHELGPLRMALDEYDAAEDKHRRAQAERRVMKLVSVGLLKVMIAAVDDPKRPGREPDPATDYIPPADADG